MAKYSLGVKFNKGIAEVDGKKFDGVIPLYTKKGYPIDAYYENGIFTGKLNKATGEHTFINKSHIKVKNNRAKQSFVTKNKKFILFGKYFIISFFYIYGKL